MAASVVVAAAAAAILLLLLPFTSSSLVSTPNPTLQYHHGHLLTGNLTLRLIWYGHFSPSQRSIITDFLLSLSENYYVRCPDSSEHQSRHVKSLRYTRSPIYPDDLTRLNCHPDHYNSPSLPPPSVSSWWATTRLYLSSSSTNLHLSPQLLLSSYPLGRSLSSSSLTSLASLKMEEGEGRRENSLPSSSSISIILTSSDVVVDGFCSSRCGTHSRLPNAAAFIWVGDSSAQCPGQCAWPFHQPSYGPKSPPLVSPTGDVGADGIVINLATLLAGTVTNPDGKGFFQGPPEAPLEAVSACTGIFGSGAYPGFPGKVLVDHTSGASYNAQGVNGRKYLLPAMWDPKTSQCATLV